MIPHPYTPPDDPADPESAALEMIVRSPVAILEEPGRLLHPLIEVLQDFAGILPAEGAFTGLPWVDAKLVAAAIVFDLCMRDDAEEYRRLRAEEADSGASTTEWTNRAAVARAFRIAANAMGYEHGQQ